MRGVAEIRAAGRRRRDRAATASHTIRRVSVSAIALVLATGIWLPTASASADAAHKIIDQCEEGKTPTGFSLNDYFKATNELEAYGVEYTECPQLIEEAELAAAGAKHHGGSTHRGGPTPPSGTSGTSNGGGGSSPESTGTSQPIVPTAEEQRQIAHALKGPESVKLGHGPMGAIHPGVVHADVASAFNSLPAPLLAVLAAMVAGIAALAGWTIRERILSDGNPH